MLTGAGLDRVRVTNLLTGADRTIGLEAHGTRSPWIGTRMPHGLVILLASERRPRCAPVGPKRRVQPHDVGNSGQQFRWKSVLHMRNMGSKWNSRCGVAHVYAMLMNLV